MVWLFLLLGVSVGAQAQINANGISCPAGYAFLSVTAASTQKIPLFETVNGQQMVKLQDSYLSLADYNKALAVQQTMAKRGVETEILLSPRDNFEIAEKVAPEDRQLHSLLGNKALLGIVSIKDGATKDGIYPGRKVFESKQLQQYLDLARDSGGAIVIDPAMPGWSTKGYLNEGTLLPGKAWVLALRPDANGSTLVHEWQHKVDLIDRLPEYQAALLGTRLAAENPELLKSKLFMMGKRLEEFSAAEVTATARQLQFYVETKRVPPFDAISTAFYREHNTRKMALGRIMMDPTNPNHYVVLFASGTIVTVSSFVALQIVLKIIEAETANLFPSSP